MGKCITVIKIIGATSLGIATGTLSYTSLRILPDLIENDSYSIDQLGKLVKDTIIRTRVVLASFGSIATYALLLAYNKSAIKGKHPYLIYAAIGFPLSLIHYFYQSYQNEEKLLKIAKNNNTTNKISQNDKSNSKSSPKKNFASSLDNSIYQDLGRTSSQEDDEEEEEEIDTDDEVNNAIIKKESSLNLDKLKLGYNIVAGFTGAAFAIATIGLIGDKY